MKNNTFLLQLILEICQIINGERSKMGIANILYGKKNHQTWSDLFLYQLHKYYRFLYKEDEKRLHHAFDELIRLEYIIVLDNDAVHVTETGKKCLFIEERTTHSLTRNGHIVQSMNDYWSFLHLLIQTLSNLLYNQRNFLPAIRDGHIQAQVKSWLKAHSVSEGAAGIVSDLTAFLEALPEHYSNMLALRLSGNHRIGLTIEQLSKRYNITYLEAKWQWESILSELHKKLMNMEFHFLPHLHEKPNPILSQSCKQTWSLLQSNLSITEVSKIRNLKEATIMDHIVELALIGLLTDYSNYLSEDEFKNIAEQYKLLQSKRLKIYKERLPNLSYFKIRLAIAILSRGNRNETESISNEAIWIH